MKEIEENRELPTLEYYKNNKDWPIYCKELQLNIGTIFKICLQRDVPEERMVKKRPMRVTTAATFVVNQKQVGLKHPFD